MSSMGEASGGGGGGGVLPVGQGAAAAAAKRMASSFSSSLGSRIGSMLSTSPHKATGPGLGSVLGLTSSTATSSNDVGQKPGLGLGTGLEAGSRCVIELQINMKDNNSEMEGGDNNNTGAKTSNNSGWTSVGWGILALTSAGDLTLPPFSYPSILFTPYSSCTLLTRSLPLFLPVVHPIITISPPAPSHSSNITPCSTDILVLCSCPLFSSLVLFPCLQPPTTMHPSFF